MSGDIIKVEMTEQKKDLTILLDNPRILPKDSEYEKYLYVLLQFFEHARFPRNGISIEG
jgi:hypothetical protein